LWHPPSRGDVETTGPPSEYAHDITLLCSASKDSIVLWNVEAAYAAIEEGIPAQPVGDTNQPSHIQQNMSVTATMNDVLLQIIIDLQTTFKTDLQHVLHGWYQVGFLSQKQGLVEALAVDATRTILAACISNAVHILEIPTGRCIFRVEGHSAVVTSVAFALHAPHLLITTAEDRTFKVLVAYTWRLASVDIHPHTWHTPGIYLSLHAPHLLITTAEDRTFKVHMHSGNIQGTFRKLSERLWTPGNETATEVMRYWTPGICRHTSTHLAYTWHLSTYIYTPGTYLASVDIYPNT
jgi:WD40 repeat protein